MCCWRPPPPTAPLITSYIHGCRETVSPGSGLTCKVQDEESLYRAMKYFLTLSWEEREEMGLEGRNLMKRRFAKGDVVEETLKAIFL